MARSWFQQPLLHFTLIGGVLAGVRALTADRAPERIVVDPGTTDALVADFERSTGRAPSPTERAELLRLWSDDEMLVREARAIGLDRGDPVVRRRLRQRMGYVLEDAALVPEPSDDQLAELLDELEEDLGSPARRELTQVLLRDTDEDTVARMKAELKAGGDPASLGQPTAYGIGLSARTKTKLAVEFGEAFADTVFAAGPGEWIEARSGHGLHLVRVESVRAAIPASLEDPRTREQLRLRWVARERSLAADAALVELRDRYRVEVGA